MFENLFVRNGLSLDRLHGFLLVANASSYVTAANNDPIRQSLLSRQVRDLEMFFGAQLTERRGKGIVISKAGHRLAALIRQQLQGLEDFQNEQAGVPKEFVIGAGASTMEWIVLPRLHDIAALLGNAMLRVETHRSRGLVDAVREGKVDFAVVREDALLDGQPRASLAKVSFVLCVPRRIAGNREAKSFASREVWSKLPLAIPSTGGQFHAELVRACEASGAAIHPAVQCHSFLQVRELVETGEFAGILPSVGIDDLDTSETILVPFVPLKHYGRSLVLHWNERQMVRRGLESRDVKAIAAILRHQLSR